MNSQLLFVLFGLPAMLVGYGYFVYWMHERELKK